MLKGSRRGRAIVVALTAFITTAGAVVIAAPSAFAHSNAVTGWAQCSSDGTYQVSWTVANDYPSGENVSVVTLDPAGSTLAPRSAHLEPHGTGTAMQSEIPGSATSAALTVKGVWDVDGYTQNDWGSVALDGTCLPSHTPTKPTARDGQCTDGAAVPGEITIPADDGVAYTLDGTVTGAGGYPVSVGSHIVEATSKTLKLTGQTSFTFDVKAAPTCSTSVSPVAPEVTDAVCVVGSSDPTAPSITLPTTSGVVYEVAPAGPYKGGQTVTVTATAGSGRVFAADAPAGWTRIDDTHETYSVKFALKTCASTVTPVAPAVYQSHCGTTTDPVAPSLTLARTTGIDYTVDPQAPYSGGESVLVTATATGDGVLLPDLPSGWTYVDDHHATFVVVFDASPTCASPQAPTITNSVCATDGTISAPTIVLATTTGVSYTLSASAPFVAGQTVTVTASTDDAYEFGTTEPTGWTYVDPHHATFSTTFPAAPHCSQAALPTFSDAVCTDGSTVSPTYTIPFVTGVDYYVKNVQVSPGVHPATAGSSVVITAVAQSGYTLTGTTSFTHRFAAAPDCRTAVVAAAPTFIAGTCNGTNLVSGTYTIPATVGVDYFVGGVVVATGKYPVASGQTIVVTARAADGYALSGVTMWTYPFPANESCTTAVKAVQPTLIDPGCQAGSPQQSSYTIPNLVGVDYFVNVTGGTSPAPSGTPVPSGTYHSSPLSTVTVTAVAQIGYRLVGRTVFTLHVPKPPTCIGTVIPASVRFSDTTCLTSGAGRLSSYAVPDSSGVRYTVNGAPVDAGIHTVAAGVSITVLAHADAGYTLSGITDWAHLFKGRATCGGGLSGTSNSTGSSLNGTLSGPANVVTNSGAATAYTGVPADTLTLGALILLLFGGAFLFCGTYRRRAHR